MITDGMTRWLIAEAAKAGPDSSTRAIVDWILLGRYSGFRASESSQTTQKDYARIEHWPGKPARAFTRPDFGFLANNERHPSGNELSEDLIRYLNILWRIQKIAKMARRSPLATIRKIPHIAQLESDFASTTARSAWERRTTSPWQSSKIIAAKSGTQQT